MAGTIFKAKQERDGTPQVIEDPRTGETTGGQKTPRGKVCLLATDADGKDILAEIVRTTTG